MAAATAVKSSPPLDFFFVLSADQREFLYPGNRKERLSLRTLSLGFGAREEEHVLEAEHSHGVGVNAKLGAQTTAMPGVHPNLPVVTVPTTVLTPPVTFRLKSGPGPLYVSGSRLFVLEEAGQGAPAQKRAKVAPGASKAPLSANTLQKPTAKDGARAISGVKNTSQGGKASNQPKKVLNKKK